jgi:type I restriction enzyme M protein
MRKDKGLSGELDRIPVLTWVMFLKFLDDWESIREQEALLARKSWRPICEPPYRWRDWAAREDGITGSELIAFVNQDEAVRPDGTRGPGLFAYLRSLRSDVAYSPEQVVATVFSGITNRMINGYLLRDVINLVNEIHFSSSDDLHSLGHLYESLLREMRDAAGDSGEFYTPRPVVRFMVDVVDPQLGEMVLDPATGTGGFLVEAFQHLAANAKTVEDQDHLQRHSIRGGEPKPLPYLLAQMNLLLHGLESPQIDPLNSLRTPLREIGEKDRVEVILTNPPFGGEEERGIRRNFPRDLQTSETALLFLQLIMRRLRREPPGRAAVVVPNTTLFYPGVAAKIRRLLLTDFNLHTIVRLPKGVFEPYTDIETNLLFFDAAGPTSKVLYYRLDPPDERKQYTKTRPLQAEQLAEARRLIKERSADSPSAWFVDGDVLRADDLCNLDQHNPKVVRDTDAPPREVLDRIHVTLAEADKRLSSAQESISTLSALTATREAWQAVELASALKRRRDVVMIEDDETYKRLRIQVKGRGVLLRDEVPGAEIGTKRQFRVEAGQFVLSKIDARNGAFGVVPDECDKGIITGNFWAYDVDSSVLSPRLLKYLTQSDAFLHFCMISSPGATNRRYLQEDQFLAQQAVVPKDISSQEALVDALDALSAVAQSGEATQVQLRQQFPALLQSALHHVFGASEEEADSEALAEAQPA